MKKITILFPLLLFSSCKISSENNSKFVEETKENQKTDPIDTLPCRRMYKSIEKFSKKYEIPRNFAYGIAWAETRYSGPCHEDYVHSLGSYAGAVGPMQIMPSTAKRMWPDSQFTIHQLKHDIDFNVETSMKILRYLHDKYGDWKLVFGCYNTGKPRVNQYANTVFNHQIDWIDP